MVFHYDRVINITSVSWGGLASDSEMQRWSHDLENLYLSPMEFCKSEDDPSSIFHSYMYLELLKANIQMISLELFTTFLLPINVKIITKQIVKGCGTCTSCRKRTLLEIDASNLSHYRLWLPLLE